MAVDGSDNIYVTDHYNGRVQVFDSTGTFLTRWWRHSVAGTDPGDFYYPDGVAIDASGDIYVADKDHNRIQKFGDPRLDFFLGDPLPSQPSPR
jgi:DNA-binding beta-propeller fold protein YncE